MLRKIFDKEKVSEDLLNQAAELTLLPEKDLKKTVRQLLKDDPEHYDDVYVILLKARSEGFYRGRGKRVESIARLRCLVDIDKPSAGQILSNTKPAENVIHALERLMRRGSLSNEDGNRAILQFVLGCSRDRAVQHSQSETSISDMIASARSSRHITEKAAETAKRAYCTLLEPEVVEQVAFLDMIQDGDNEKLYEAVHNRGIASLHAAMMRDWKRIDRDEVEDILAKGYGNSMEDAKNEYLARFLMAKYKVDRAHAKSELQRNQGNLERAGVACGEHARLARKNLEADPIIPTRDTRSSPNLTPHTRVISVLGVDEPDVSSRRASPSLGDGWMVSDFYLWLHIFQGMGKSQEWITSLAPDYLLDKYGREDKVTTEEVGDDDDDDDDPAQIKPVQTKWATGFVHGDPFETRRVVLDDDLLPHVRDTVTIGPHGPDLRKFFLKRLEDTIADAALFGDRVVIMIFALGDYDSQGGLCLGVNLRTYNMNEILRPADIASVLAKYPNVMVTMYMTSCYSGHWVETTEFQGSDLRPAVPAAVEKEQESFGFAWSHSQRHTEALFSSAAVGDLMKESASLLSDVDMDTSRQYHELITSLTAEMNRLCLPVNISLGYGSSPVFTDDRLQEKFWRRTGYYLHDYRANYNKLRTIPASDPHPKRNRKKFDAGYLDSNEPDVLAWEKRHPGLLDEDYPEATAGYGGTRRGLVSFSSLNYLIKAYYWSKPPKETMEHLAMMDFIRTFYDGVLKPAEKLHLRHLLISRLAMNKKANQYAKLLGLYRFQNIESWSLAQTSRECDMKTFYDYARKIADSGIFHPRAGKEGIGGPYYRRPSQYLAAAMAIAGYNKWDVTVAVERILEMQENRDSVTLDYMETARYSECISSIRSMVRSTWGRSQSQTQNRPAL